MGIPPIPRIRGVGSVDSPLLEREIRPAFALDRSERMKDDAYQGSRDSAERGMEEDSEPAADSNTDETSSTPSDPDIGVSLFA